MSNISSVLVAPENWFLGQGTFNGPASVDALGDGFAPEASTSGPLLKSEGFSAQCQQAVIPSVVLLFTLGRPAAVTRFVIAAGVNTIKSKAAWALSHISKEVLEYPPALAHLNALRSVFRKGSGVGICASLNHVAPNAVGARPALVVRRVALNAYLALLISVKAAARSGVMLSKRLCAHLNRVAAIAATLKKCAAKFVSTGTANHQQASETLSGQVNVGRHVPQLYPVGAGMSIGDCQSSGVVCHV